MELAKLTTTEVQHAINQAHVALLPVGAMEQHGPHLPLGTDWFTAAHIARVVSQESNRLLLPGLPVGVSREHRQFMGTLTLSPDQLRDYAMTIARSPGTHGLRRMVFVNGHATNCNPLEDAARGLREERIHAFVFNWWHSLASLLADLFPQPTAHAGSLETSIMLAIHPEIVHPERFDKASSVTQWGAYVEGVLVGFDTIDFTREGNVGDPRLGDAEKGREVLTAACESLDRFCRWLTARTDEELATQPHVD